MRPTIQYVKMKFDEFNILLFDGMLPSISFVITDSVSYGGLFVCKKSRDASGNWSICDLQIRISKRFDLPEKDLEDIIIHEMIHYYIFYKKIKDNSKHGRIFTQKMKEINDKFNRNVKISTTYSKEIFDGDTRMRLHYLCVSELQDGRCGVTVTAKSRIFDIWNTLPELFQLKKYTWYASFNSYFNRFPKVQKPKIYSVDKKELMDNLENAVELERKMNVIEPKKL